MVTFYSYEIVLDDRKEAGNADLSGGRSVIRFKGGELTVSSCDGKYDLSIVPTEDCFIESVTLRGSVPVLSENAAFLSNGFQSWSPSGAMGPDERQSGAGAFSSRTEHDHVLNAAIGRKGSHTSECFFFYGDRLSGNGLFAAQMPPFGQFLSFTFKFGGKHHDMSVSWDLGRKLKRREDYALDQVLFRSGACNDLLEAWANTVSSRLKLSARDGLRTGWSSWHHYKTSVTPDAILANLEHAKKNRFAFDFFRLDDGYQTSVGDWLNLKDPFKGRMREIAGRIRAAGPVPGLWIAPFIISPRSAYFSRPGWVLHDKKGKPVAAGKNPAWGEGDEQICYALDLTHPGVQDYIRDVFTAVKRDWGFEYLKLDYMYAASLPGVRHDRTVTRAGALRLGCRLIREAVGKSMHLSGSRMPLSGAIGTVDSLRISCDVSSDWGMHHGLLGLGSGGGTSDAFRNIMVRSFMDKRLWINDPDSLVLRADGSVLSNEERRSQFNLVMTAGGSFEISDDFLFYGETESAKLHSALDLFRNTRNGHAKPMDILGGKMPEVFVNSAGFVTVFNFSSAPAQRRISSEMLSAAGFRINRIIKNVETGIRYELTRPAAVQLGAHDSAMFKIEG